MKNDGAILLFGRLKPHCQRESVGATERADARVNDGVVAAVIPNADSKDIAAIATRRKELTERARSRRTGTAL